MKQVVRWILFQNNSILLVKHIWQSIRTLPGGHIEKNETPYETLIREIKEELNLEIKIVKNTHKFNLSDINNIQMLPLPIGIYKISYTHRFFWPTEKLEYIFKANIVWWNLKIQSSEIAKANFFSVNEINNLKQHLYEQFRVIINSAI